MNERVLWKIIKAFPNLIVGGVMIPHGVAKITRAIDFENKFDLSRNITYAASSAELSGAFGLFLAGALFFASQTSPSPIQVIHRIVTALSIAAILVVQVGAIVTVHAGHGWFYFAGGVEYNVVLLSLLLLVTLCSLDTGAARI